MPLIVIIAHNIRSNHNVGSIFRTAEGLGVNKIYLTGYTPYPKTKNESRLPHIANSTDRAISKVSLGAEKIVEFEYQESVKNIIESLKSKEYKIIGLEQAKNSQKLVSYKASEKLALILGNEVDGIDSETLSLCDDIIEIPMSGKKESFNVVQAMAIATYHLKYVKP